ncbi:cleavage and polyadenylation specificity factor subunit 2-like [Paramacrobiotus metropolitanus]|uniref:cleavage and polyadenylation specificity factor subunit 2-like n=1 Tax=Paramacrobiotus metropolitanus TaxID=2943436 RepID=UPI00244632D8|nr:cleavage and polyadenylation specificity factor subunit 2-like [Paramacrobiotus metropolitanus]
MPSIIHFQPFNGVHQFTPFAYLLEIDGFNILLDCGWDERFDLKYVEELAKIAPRLDCVLLTSPDLYHVGALPYLVGRMGLECPVYATSPVYKMGQMFMYDLYQSRHDYEDFDLFTLDHIDAAFDRIIQVKYNQTVALKGKGEGIRLTALCAGHMLGACLWKIGKDEEEIVYAVDFAHKKERHLSALSLDSINRPHLLICDILNGAYNPPKRRTRDEELMTTILQTLRQEGDVLICIDTAGRVLELAYMLDQLWQNKESGLNNFGVCILNNVAYNAIEFAKSQVEWMSDKLVRGFEDNRQNPFAFTNVQLCHSQSELKKVKSPKVVVASPPDLECGFSRNLFMDYARHAKNTIVFTYRTTVGTLAHFLIQNPRVPVLTIDQRRRVPLEGTELKEYMDKKREEQLAKALRDQEAKEEAELKASDMEADLDMPMPEKGAVTIQQSDLYIRPCGKMPFHLLKRGPKPNAMYRFERDQNTKDEFGVSVDVETMRNRLKEINKGVEVEPSPKDGASKTRPDDKMDDDSEEIADEVPTKTISTPVTVEIKATLKFIDFEGRVDADSLQKILTFINPKRLIMVHGSPQTAEVVANFMTSHCQMNTEHIFYPDLLKTVDCSSETHIYRAKLSDAFLRNVQWKPVKGGQMALVHCKAWYREPVADKEEMASEFDIPMAAAHDPNVPTLEPTQSKKFAPASAPLVINNYKLSDIQKFLRQHGIYSDFLTGSLVCSRCVVISKTQSGKLTVQGPFSVEYYRIRKLLYKQFCVF